MPKKPKRVEPRREFEIEYTPLELLLMALIDGAGETDKHRSKRLSQTHELLTGIEMVRVDDPHSIMARAVFDMMLRDRENRDNQIAEAHGGPKITSPDDLKRYEETNYFALANDIFPDDEDTARSLYRRANGTYDHALVKASPIGYVDAIRAWAWDYDERAESELRRDFIEVARILGKHGITMDLSRLFSRLGLVGKS